MKTEIKRTPITFNGEDGFEVLYEDSDIFVINTCNLCMYKNDNNRIDCQAPCCTIHKCLPSRPTYFKFIK